MQKIAMVLEDGRFGGPHVYVYQIAKALSGESNVVVVFPEKDSVQFKEILQKNNINFKVLSISRLTKEVKVIVRYILFSTFDIIRLTYYFKKENFSCVYACGGAWQYKAVISAKLAGIKLIWHMNDTYIPWIFRKCFSILSDLPNIYIYASERSHKYYGSLMHCKKNEYVIPAPVDCRYFSKHLKLEGDEKLISKWNGKIVLGTICNINRIKGIDIFVHFVSEMNKYEKGLVFVVVGPVYKSQEKYFKKIQNLCLELGVANIEFIGDRVDVRPLLKRFDLYMCTSYAESSPISVWEAMSMGKAIISTDVGDVSRFVDNENYKSGEIVEVGNYKEMANRCQLLLENTNLKSQYEINASIVAREKLDVKLCADAHKAVFDELINT